MGTDDFNRDAQTDLLWRFGATGELSVWYMNAFAPTSAAAPLSFGNTAIAGLRLAGTADFDRDGAIDILWHDRTTGKVSVSYMNGTSQSERAELSQAPAVLDSTNFRIVGTGDFDRDGWVDILWHNSVTGEEVVWYVINGTLNRSLSFDQSYHLPAPWRPVQIDDFDEDSKIDVLWQNGTIGEPHIWYMDDRAFLGYAPFPNRLWLDDNSKWTVANNRQ